MKDIRKTIYPTSSTVTGKKILHTIKKKLPKIQHILFNICH